jgi:excinuclease ABC subunit B
MYADTITNSIQQAINETERRRKIQMEYNKANNITPESIKKGIYDVLSDIAERDYYTVPLVRENEAEYIPDTEIPAIIRSLEKEMRDAAKKMEFEKAAELRDRIKALKERGMAVGVKA